MNFTTTVSTTLMLLILVLVRVRVRVRVSGDGDSVRTRRGKLASRRKASEASRKIERLKFQRFCRVVRRCDEVALTKRLMGECAAATKILRIYNY